MHLIDWQEYRVGNRPYMELIKGELKDGRNPPTAQWFVEPTAVVEWSDLCWASRLQGAKTVTNTATRYQLNWIILPFFAISGKVNPV